MGWNYLAIPKLQRYIVSVYWTFVRGIHGTPVQGIPSQKNNNAGLDEIFDVRVLNKQ